MDDDSVSENTYVRFINNGSQLKVVFQKLILHDKAYELKDLFGHRERHEEPECDICKEFAKDTIVVPCYHMCLCRNCANIMRGQYNSKCPICRTPVESLLTIRVE